MPKVQRNANLGRVVRRRIASLDNLPSPLTRRIDNAEGGITVQIKGSNANATSFEKERRILDKKAEVDHKKSCNKNATDDDNNDETDIRLTQQLSRGQRKRQAKRDQFLRKEKMILSSLMLQRQEQQKKRIDGLDAIKQALMNTATKNKNDQNSENNTIMPELHYISTNKAKRKLVAKEVEHMNLILQHPAFKKDPLETMQEHLRNTFAEDRKQQELLSKKRTEEEKRKIETKRAEKNGIKKKSQKKKYKPRRTK